MFDLRVMQSAAELSSCSKLQSQGKEHRPGQASSAELCCRYAFRVSSHSSDARMGMQVWQRMTVVMQSMTGACVCRYSCVVPVGHEPSSADMQGRKIDWAQHLVCLIHHPATGHLLQQALGSLQPDQLGHPARLRCLCEHTEIYLTVVERWLEQLLCNRTLQDTTELGMQIRIRVEWSHSRQQH